MRQQPSFSTEDTTAPTSAIRALGNFRETGAQICLLLGLTGVVLIVYLIYAEYWLDRRINIIIKILPFILFLGAIAAKQKEAQAASNAHQGATAEEDIFSLLESELVPLGWRFRYNEKLAARWDIDIVALSPAGKTYIIDVKSHKGTKLVTKEGVFRLYQGQISEFEKDVLKGVLSQAVTLRNRDNLRWVTPLLCFTEGWIEYETNERTCRRVMVVSKRQIVPSLRGLEG